MAQPLGAVLRCKLNAGTVTRHMGSDGEPFQESVRLHAVYGKDGTDNAHWAKATPGASFDITISNPDAIGLLIQGCDYYVDFIPA